VLREIYILKLYNHVLDVHTNYAYYYYYYYLISSKIIMKQIFENIFKPMVNIRLIITSIPNNHNYVSLLIFKFMEITIITCVERC